MKTVVLLILTTPQCVSFQLLARESTGVGFHAALASIRQHPVQGLSNVDLQRRSTYGSHWEPTGMLILSLL